MNEVERQAAIEKIAADIYAATGRDLTDAIDRLTRPSLDTALFVAERMPEPTPYQRGVLSRYQDGQPWRRRKSRRG